MGGRTEREGGAEGASRLAICGQRILFKSSSRKEKQERRREERRRGPGPLSRERRSREAREEEEEQEEGEETHSGGGGSRRSERWASRRSERRRNRRGSRGLRRARRTAREEEAEGAEEEKGVGVEGGRGDALLWMLDFGFLDSLADSPSLPRSGLGWPHEGRAAAATRGAPAASAAAPRD